MNFVKYHKNRKQLVITKLTALFQKDLSKPLNNNQQISDILTTLWILKQPYITQRLFHLNKRG